ncbi:MAG TPA: YggL family protein [Candidatus Avibacteroides avistercoris]|uniref:YggL family protein n=1 Tax=Candidatus Avibacteroides avistercoris TaxID=2840690 RepID=A0A9D2ZU32_9BACT|nr:YggL family protein [Candidatus Avibacteroides avistercoris]
MKKRLRKKLYKGEFKELGFSLSFNYDSDNTEDGYALLDEIIAHATANGLCVGGYFGEEGCKASFFVISAKRGSVTEEQRSEFAEWLKNTGKVNDLKVGQLRDAWYDWEE